MNNLSRHKHLNHVQFDFSRLFFDVESSLSTKLVAAGENIDSNGNSNKYRRQRTRVCSNQLSTNETLINSISESFLIDPTFLFFQLIQNLASHSNEK